MEVKEEPWDCNDSYAPVGHATSFQSDHIPSIQSVYTISNIPCIPHSTPESVMDQVQQPACHHEQQIQIKSEPVDEDFLRCSVKSEILDYSYSTCCNGGDNATEPIFPVVYGSIRIKEENVQEAVDLGEGAINDHVLNNLRDLVTHYRTDSLEDDGIPENPKKCRNIPKEAKSSKRSPKQAGKLNGAKCTKPRKSADKSKVKKSPSLKISDSLYSNKNSPPKSPKKGGKIIKTKSGRGKKCSGTKKTKILLTLPGSVPDDNVLDVSLSEINVAKHIKDSCNIESEEKANVEKHIKDSCNIESEEIKLSDSSEKNFSCGLCDNKFTLLLQLTSHMKEHTLARNLEIYKQQGKCVCKQCGRMFSSAKNLEHHSSLKLCSKKRLQTLQLRKQKLLASSDRKQRAAIKKQIARQNLPHKYPCDQCGRLFKFQYQVRYHKKIYHSDAKPVKCDMCEKTFVHPHTLKYHMRRHDDYRPFKCDECDKAFYTRTSLKQHRFKHADTKAYKCDICGDEFRYGPSLFSHKKIHEGYKPYECTHCKKGFRTSNALKSHTAMVHMKLEVFSCIDCGKSFNLKSALNVHISKFHRAIGTEEQSHETSISEEENIDVEGNNNDPAQPMLVTLSPASSQRYRDKIMPKGGLSSRKSEAKTKAKRDLMKDRKSKKKFQCSDCEKAFSHQGYLLKHMKLHSGENIFKCQVCQLEFSTQPLLNQHNRAVHQVNGSYPCQECSKTFTVMSQLNSHMMTHTGYRPYKCEICGKGFRSSSLVNDHMAKHTGERAFKCQYCDKTFKYKHQIRNHEKAHAKDRPFICDICGRGFNYQSYLKTHMREHTGERPFKCTLCEKSFKQRPHLVTHMRTHTGEKPFQCQVCQKAFSQGHHLKAHHLQHHMDQ